MLKYASGDKMGLSRPVRALGLASFCLFLFVAYQLLRETPKLSVHPVGEKIEKWDQDPLLDRRLSNYDMLRL